MDAQFSAENELGLPGNCYPTTARDVFEVEPLQAFIETEEKVRNEETEFAARREKYFKPPATASHGLHPNLRSY